MNSLLDELGLGGLFNYPKIGTMDTAMNIEHDTEKLKEDDKLIEQEDDWLDTSKACNRDDPECEACQ